MSFEPLTSEIIGVHIIGFPKDKYATGYADCLVDVRSAVLGLKKNICYCSSYSAVECNGCSMVRLWFRGVLKE